MNKSYPSNNTREVFDRVCRYPSKLMLPPKDLKKISDLEVHCAISSKSESIIAGPDTLI